MARPLKLLLLGLCSCPLATIASLGAVHSEEAALEFIANPSLDIPSEVVSEDVAQLVHRGWHDAVQALVARSQKTSDEVAQKVAALVRHAVYAERKALDDLVRALDRNYGKAVDVSPAMQWAQNSTHVFIAVKFAQRWNAPGALEVENTTVDFTGCCFNFTAFGEHSFIRRRYHLSFEFFKKITPSASSWFLAAAGRVTVVIAKASIANWPRLFSSAEAQPKNLGTWLDMKAKWQSDLEKLPIEKTESKKTESKKEASAPAAKEKKEGSKKKKAKRKEAEEEADEDEVDREVELLGDCPTSAYVGTSVAELCAKTFREVVENPAVKSRRWLVEMYSSTGTGDLEAMKKLMPMMKRLADVFPSMAPGGRVGAVDCGVDKELCKRLGATKLPQIRRFSGSASGAEWQGGIDASMEAIATWGSSKDEL